MSETIVKQLKVKEAITTLYSLISDRIELLSSEWQKKLSKIFSEILRYDEDAILGSGCHKDILNNLVNLYNALLESSINESKLSTIERQLVESLKELRRRVDKRIKLNLSINRTIVILVSTLFILSLGVTITITHSIIQEVTKMIVLSTHSLSILLFIGITYQLSLSKGNITKSHLYTLLPFLILMLLLSSITNLISILNMATLSLTILNIVLQILVSLTLILLLYKILVLNRVKSIYVELRLPTGRMERINLSEVLNREEWKNLHKEYERIYGTSSKELLKYEINILCRKGLTLDEIYNILKRRISSYRSEKR